jgi:SAM-dependent methyltransferase
MIFSKEVVKVGTNDILNYFSFIDENRVIPEYIECSAIKTVLMDLNIDFTGVQAIQELINLLPKDYLASVAKVIDNKMYTSRGKTDYSKTHHVYVLYYLCINIYKIWKPLMDLLITNKLKRNITVLDIGTGPGSVAIGIIEFFRVLASIYKEQEFCIRFTLVDSQAKFLDYSKNIIKDINNTISGNLRIETQWQHREISNSTKLEYDEDFDIVTISNFINAFEHDMTFNADQFLIDIKKVLRKDGNIIIIEPGNKEECIALKELRNSLYNRKEFGVYAPCASIWCQRQNFDCTCFTSYNLPWKKPIIVNVLHDKGLNKLKYKSYVSFNYLILRKDLSRKYLTEINKLDYTMLSDIENFSGERINIKGILRFKSENTSTISLCDGSIDSSRYPVYINLNDKTNQRNYKILSRVNMGELITVRNARIKTRKKDKIELEIDEKTKVEVKY